MSLQAGEHGGDVHAGFAAKMSEVAAFYEGRCGVFLAAAERHLGNAGQRQNLARWSVPDAGMFVWLELLGVADSHALVTQHCAAAKVLLVPGRSFMPSWSNSNNVGATPLPTSHVRAAFSTASDDEIDEALRRFAALLREQQRA